MDVIEFISNFKKVDFPNLGFIKMPQLLISAEQRKEVDLEENATSENVLIALAKRNFDLKLHNNVIPPDKRKEYFDRLEFELTEIIRLQFTDYILLVYQIINFCKDNGILTSPGRGCLNGDVLVRMENGYKKLRNLEIGDKVAVQSGNFLPIKNKFTYDCNEELLKFKISANSCNDILLTKDHKVLCLKNPFLGEYNDNKKMDSVKGFQAMNLNAVFDITEAQWIQADKVNKNDYLIRRVKFKTREIEPSPIDLSIYADAYNDDYVFEHKLRNNYTRTSLSTKVIRRETGLAANCIINIRRGGKSLTTSRYKLDLYLKRINKSFADFLNYSPTKNLRYKRYIFIDEAFMYMFGYFIGDGWLQTKGSTIGFAFHSENNIRQLDLIKAIIEKYGFEYSIRKGYKNKKLIQLVVKSRIFKEIFLKYCPFNTYSKIIPNEFLQYNEKLLDSLYGGLLDSDGHVSRKGFSYDTVNFNLAIQVRDLLEKLGYKCNISKRISKNINWADSYKVQTSFQRSKKQTNSYNNGDYVFCKVKEKQIINNHDGKVYDIQVENEQNYQTEEFIVHNSAASSLLLYVLGVTGVDPLRHELIFERFISSARTDVQNINGETYIASASLPDVDIDSDRTLKYKVNEFIDSKFPKKSAPICTFGTFQSRILIKECLKVVENYKDSETKPVAEMIEAHFGKVETIDDAIENNDRFKTWAENHTETIRIARKLHGLIRNKSTHASGIIISNEELIENMPLELNSDKHVISGYEMEYAQFFGVKVDNLGLKNLGIIDNCLKLVGKKMEDVNVDDPSIYQFLALHKDYYYGIFQCEDGLGKRVLQKIEPTKIDDIMASIALGRPGSFSFIDDYVNYKKGIDVKKIDERIQDILGKTNNVMIYQESLIKLSQRMAKFTAREGDGLRKCITGDTMFISKTRGYISIKTLLEKGYKDDLFLVMDECGTQSWKKIKEIWSNGTKTARYVRANNGMYVRSTRWHQFLTDGGWKAKNYIEENDYLVCAKSIEYDGEDKISKNLSIVIAGLITEGYFVDYNSNATFVNWNAEIMSKFSSAFYCEFGDNSLGFSEDKKVARIRYKEKTIIGKILHPGKSRVKRIPEIMMGMTKETTKEFLGFMFDCEATVTENELCFTSASYRLCQQIQLLLLRFSIRSNVYSKLNKKYNRYYYYLDIGQHRDVVKFFDNLGQYITEPKRNILLNYASRTVDEVSVTDMVTPIIMRKFINQYGYTLNYESGHFFKHNVSFRNFKRFALRSKNNYWNNLANGKHDYSKVESLNDLYERDAEVFDFSMEDENTPFIIANGLVIHNCVGKKLTDKIKEYKDKFINQSIENNFEKEMVEQIWANIEMSGNYLFAASHSCAYSYITAICAYLKANHTKEFFLSLLKMSKFEAEPIVEISNIQKEMTHFGINLLPPHLIKSDLDFSIEENNIRFGLGSIKGIAEKTMERLSNFKHEYSNKFQVFCGAEEVGVSKGVLSALLMAGALDDYQ